MKQTQRAFTLIEILIVLAIILILLGITLVSMRGLQSSRELQTITDSIAAKLEEARTNAMSGKNGVPYGVTFASTSYTYWYGTSYSASSTNNIVLPISSNFVINTTLPSYTVSFARITGNPSATGTTTITSITNTSTTDSIKIGTYGDITVIK
ncbi:MAG: prepilin-type N-terminal cleavage/methylation domain-containing protein [bacterium]|nr:prepilin-type N-terminal cleavage/methylation domain-containing protein [bacterium]